MKVRPREGAGLETVQIHVEARLGWIAKQNNLIDGRSTGRIAPLEFIRLLDGDGLGIELDGSGRTEQADDKRRGGDVMNFHGVLRQLRCAFVRLATGSV